MSTHNSTTKTCAVCGQDVSAKPRTKDRNGRYFCTPCYEKVLARKHAKRAAAKMPKAPSAKNTPSPKMARTLSVTSGEPLELADDDDVEHYALDDSRPPREARLSGSAGALQNPPPKSAPSSPSKPRKPAK